MARSMTVHAVLHTHTRTRAHVLDAPHELHKGLQVDPKLEGPLPLPQWCQQVGNVLLDEGLCGWQVALLEEVAQLPAQLQGRFLGARPCTPVKLVVSMVYKVVVSMAARSSSVDTCSVDHMQR